MGFDFDQRFFMAGPPFYPTYDTGATGIEDDPSGYTTESVLQVQANPFYDNLVLSITSDMVSSHAVYLMDISDRIVRESSIRNSVSLQTDDLLCGTYILLMRTPDGSCQSCKVLKL